VLGNDGNDQIEGGYGDDVVDGGPGNDTISGTQGSDRVIGGDGDDASTPSTARRPDRLRRGNDVVSVDPVDVIVNDSCESIRGDRRSGSGRGRRRRRSRRAT
jgi:Ca2+-binding RTX toxin-like protein